MNENHVGEVRNDWSGIHFGAPPPCSETKNPATLRGIVRPAGPPIASARAEAGGRKL